MLTPLGLGCIVALLCSAAAAGTSSRQRIGGFENVSNTSQMVVLVARFVQDQVNRRAPFAAKVTRISSARKQVLTNNLNVWDVDVILTNTTCSARTNYWAACCLRSQTRSCRAFVLEIRRSSSFSAANITCSTDYRPAVACSGCIEPQTNVNNYYSIAATALRLYKQQNAISTPILKQIVSVSTQVVAGINYYIEATVATLGRTLLCNFTVWERLWLNSTVLTSASCGNCVTP